MAQQVSMLLQMDKNTKEQADSFFGEMGYNLTSAINAFIEYVVREKTVPFQMEAGNNVEQFHRLIDSIRSYTQEKGFLSDDEINAEIQAARAEMK